VHVTAQQDQERVLAKENNRNEPLRIKAVKGKRGAITPGRKFLDSDNWLKGLSFNLENISEKNIIYIELEMEFPKSDNDPPPLIHPLTYGYRPPLDSSIPADAPPPIKPGETIDLRLSDPEYARLQTELQTLKYPRSIKHAVFIIRFVVFDDGTMWDTGRLMRRDVNDPRRWVPLDRHNKTSSTPKLNFIGAKYLSLGDGFLFSTNNKSSEMRFNETHLSTGKFI
jgi:hypothetical protein